MEQEKKSKTGIILAIVAAVLVIVGVILFLVLRDKDETYRVIKVYEIDGLAVVQREGMGEIDAYANMVLESGDTILQKQGTMTLKLDEDKYVYVEENTEFVLHAEGSAANSKTTIELLKGAITNEIQNKLSDEASYEINTPNSTMAVRGTIYYVYTYVEDGVCYTKVSVFDGKVETSLVYDNGTIGKSVMVDRGLETVIYQDQKTTDYVFDAREIHYDELPSTVLSLLVTFVDDGKLDLRDDIIEEIKDLMEDDTEPENPGPFTVNFIYKNAVFGTQTVEKGELVAVPSLSPAASGDWDYDFTLPVQEDLDIVWK